MISDGEKQDFLARIRENIATHGYHVTTVAGGPSPRFSYTIGLSEVLGFELVFAGCPIYSIRDVLWIIREIIERLKSGTEPANLLLPVADDDPLTLSVVDPSWLPPMLRGVVHYYGIESIRAMQILPGPSTWTFDVPDMARPLSAELEPAWQWLQCDWSSPISPQSVAVTDLEALKGAPLVEVVRWEEAEWEMFSRPAPELTQKDLRKIPFASMLACDPTLKQAFDLEIGAGLMRAVDDSSWHPWQHKPKG